MQARTEKPPGRPTKYRPEHCRQATALCKLGATDAQMAECFGVNEATLYRWQHAHPEFRKAIRAGKLVADMKVAASLYSIAKGYEFDEEQPVKLKEVQYSPEGKKISEIERVEIVKVRRVVPPETAAIMMWLTNRQKDKWKQRVTNGHAGEGGGAVQVGDVTAKHPGKDR